MDSFQNKRKFLASKQIHLFRTIRDCLFYPADSVRRLRYLTSLFSFLFCSLGIPQRQASSFFKSWSKNLKNWANFFNGDFTSIRAIRNKRRSQTVLARQHALCKQTRTPWIGKTRFIGVRTQILLKLHDSFPCNKLI